MIPVRIQQLPHAAGLPLPAQATPGAAGLDLRAAVTETLTIAPGTWTAVPTGLCLELPQGTEGQVRPRSGLAAKHGVTVLNSPGTVDADYRGEVMVLLINHGPVPFAIRRGDRIAQLVVAPVPEVRLVPAVELTESVRGTGGHGSTGVA